MSRNTDNLVIGLLAHVDAGKTTLSEAMLYLCGNIRKMGRVDFSAEMERTLQVLDYAVLIISGSDGVQGHTCTLWKLLNRYAIPTFIFINKMDQPETNREAILKELKKRLDDGCVEFEEETIENWEPEQKEAVAVCNEHMMERYLETGVIQEEDIRRLIRNRTLFPCYFGSALKMEGIDIFFKGLERYNERRNYGDKFGAKVYKISRDEQAKPIRNIRRAVISYRRLTVRYGRDLWRRKISYWSHIMNSS